MITENTSTLKINKLTKEQYIREQEAGNIDSTALYLTPDETADLTIYATKEDLALIESTLGYECKNLIPYPYVHTTRTYGGTTITDNGDGTLTANGTATANFWFTLASKITLPIGKYILTGCPKGGTSKTYRIILRKSSDSSDKTAEDYGNGATFEVTDNTMEYEIMLGVMNGASVENLTFKPMLRRAEILDDTWKPYTPSVAENVTKIKEDIEGLQESKQDASTAITTDNIASQSVNHAETADSLTGVTATASELNVLDGITASTAELNYMDGVTSPVQTQLDGLNSNLSSHTANKSNPHSVTKAQIGLGNVDNTADSAKSVKYATNAGSATTANSVAWGNVSGKPSTYAPSSHTHSYLPLSGGTMNGTLTVQNGDIATTGNVYAQGGLIICENATYMDIYKTHEAHSIRLRSSVGVDISTRNADSWSVVRAAGFQQSSSEKIKENIKDITDEEVLKLLEVNVVSFDYKEKFGGQKDNIGVIAEQVKDLLPRVVNIPDNYSESKFDEDGGISQPIPTVDYTKFSPYLIKMVQIQQSKINELEERLSKLENN